MAYKISRPPSIEDEGVAVHVNNFFIKRGSDKRYGDVLRVRDMVIGGKKLSKQRAADELGVSRQAYIKWLKLIAKQESEDHA
jgi:ACT domain-containing protein